MSGDIILAVIATITLIGVFIATNNQHKAHHNH